MGTYTAGWNLHGGREALLWFRVTFGHARVGRWECCDGRGHCGPLTSGDGQGEPKSNSDGRDIHFEMVAGMEVMWIYSWSNIILKRRRLGFAVPDR